MVKRFDMMIKRVEVVVKRLISALNEIAKADHLVTGECMIV